MPAVATVPAAVIAAADADANVYARMMPVVLRLGGRRERRGGEHAGGESQSEFHAVLFGNQIPDSKCLVPRQGSQLSVGRCGGGDDLAAACGTVACAAPIREAGAIHLGEAMKTNLRVAAMIALLTALPAAAQEQRQSLTPELLARIDSLPVERMCSTRGAY